MEVKATAVTTYMLLGSFKLFFWSVSLLSRGLQHLHTEVPRLVSGCVLDPKLRSPRREESSLMSAPSVPRRKDAGQSHCCDNHLPNAQYIRRRLSAQTESPSRVVGTRSGRRQRRVINLCPIQRLVVAFSSYMG